MKKKIEVLDCTIRDGGYYNNWNFNVKSVQEYINSCAKAKIDIVEIGFRFSNLKKGMGIFAFTPEKLFNNFTIPKNLKLSIMINASDFINQQKEVDENLIIKLFLNKKKSQFNIVRIAINFENFLLGKKITLLLKKLGYKIGYNLMQAHDKDPQRIKEVLKNIVKWNTVDYLYYADSIGVMEPEYIKNITRNLLKNSNGIKIGIHAHNNKSLALLNTLTAIEEGIDIVDSTILGMGRGAGNTPTELLLLELKNRNYNYKSKFILDCIKYFSILHNKYKWGPNYYYYFAAINNIHPTYIQNLLGDNRYEKDQINSALDYLSKRNSNFYNENYFKTAIYNNISYENCIDSKDYFKNKNILILGSGESGKTHLSHVINYIKNNSKNLVVLSLNINPYIKKNLIDYYISCYDFRVIFEQNSLLNTNKKIIMPYTNFRNYLKANDRIINYGLKLKKNSFNIFNKYCELDSPLALSYALAFCISSNTKSITFAFIDGYKDNIVKNNEIKFYLRKFKKRSNIKFKFITPSLFR